MKKIYVPGGRFWELQPDGPADEKMIYESYLEKLQNGEATEDDPEIPFK